MAMATDLPEKEVIKSTIIKLLEKANRHPSLTPRLLRNKVEEKLKLKQGETMKQYKHMT